MDIKKIFKNEFKEDLEYIFWSPGRVNIIGEHTDYHDGFVMPLAINLGIMWGISKRADQKICGYSEKFDESGCFNINDTERTKFEWLLYLQGVIEIIKKRNKKISGLNFAISSTIPIGSGLSSSSSLSTGFTFILNEIFNLGFSPQEIAKIACEAEWWYGTTGGIMDQFCIANGRKNKSILLDCRTLKYEEITIPNDIEIVVFETTIRHKQIDSPFDLRRKQTERVIEIAQEKYSNLKITKTRDLNLKILNEIKNNLINKFGKEEGEKSYRRALHSITENLRVIEMKQAFNSNDKKHISSLLYQSHESLRYNYEVSCFELDKAVEIASTIDGIIGARMVGGGFGGCIMCLVKKGRSKKFAGQLEEKFRRETGIKGNNYICLPSDGVLRIM